MCPKCLQEFEIHGMTEFLKLQRQLREFEQNKSALSQVVFHDDVREMLLALGLGDHARPYSAHLVVRNEILPEIKRLRSK